MMRRRWLWLLLIAVLLVGGGAYYTTQMQATADEPAEAPLQTAMVRRGDIQVSATGAGAIIPASSIELSFQTSGILAELLVSVGDDVEAGDVLARLDSSSAQQSVTQAELQLAQAALTIDEEKISEAKLLASLDVTQAEINVEEAQSALDELLAWQPDADDIALAELQLAAAQASYEAALSNDAVKGNSLVAAEISLAGAEQDLVAAQANYDSAWSEERDWETFYNEPICDPGEQQPCSGQTWQQRIERERESTTTALARAQDNLRIAQASFSSTAAGINNTGSSSAEVALLSAQQALSRVQTPPTEREIDAARAAVRQAAISLQRAEINRANAGDVSQAEISYAQAELSLASAKDNLAQTTLVAPADGTIMTVAADLGEQVGSGVFISLADLRQPTLELFLDETDLDKVGVGFEVDVIFDALPDDLFSGQVVQVDPQLIQSGGVTAVRALVQLDADSFAKPQTLPIGLNATVEVIGGRAEDALLVPVEALRELSAGQYALFVVLNGEPQLRMVEVGIMDFSFAEITSGVTEGETVSTGIVQTQ